LHFSPFILNHISPSLRFPLHSLPGTHRNRTRNQAAAPSLVCGLSVRLCVLSPFFLRRSFVLTACSRMMGSGYADARSVTKTQLQTNAATSTRPERANCAWPRERCFQMNTRRPSVDNKRRACEFMEVLRSIVGILKHHIHREFRRSMGTRRNRMRWGEAVPLVSSRAKKPSARAVLTQ
jgi:hypothetical protein